MYTFGELLSGIGKTELAIAAARALESYFEGRVIWLDCGPNDAYAIQTRLAAALGITLKSDDLQVRADTLDLAFRQRPTERRPSFTTQLGRILPTARKGRSGRAITTRQFGYRSGTAASCRHRGSN